MQAKSIDKLMFVFGFALLLAVLGLSYALATKLGDLLTRNTIRLSLAWYLAALLGMLYCSANDWSAETLRGRFTRWCWTWAIVGFLVHLGLAFHYFHHWSHAHALEHTRRVAGVGEGIYVSYTFTLLWLADVSYWWLAPRRYAARSVWIDRTLHAMMLFIVFNGTVIYESGPIRWVALVSFVVLGAGGLAWLWRLPARSSWEA